MGYSQIRLLIFTLCWMISSWGPRKINNLWLDEGSVSNSESNSERNDACDESGTVSNDHALIDIGGLGGEGGHGGGERGDRGCIPVLVGGLRVLGDGGERLNGPHRRGAGGRSHRREGRSAGNDGHEEDGNSLAVLHVVYLLRKMTKGEGGL
jgi:hypothetical protein